MDPLQTDMASKEAKLKQIIMLSILLVAAQSAAQKKDTSTGGAELTKFADIQDYGDSLIAEGTWRPESQIEKTDFPDSVSHLECYKAGGRHLVGSNAYCMQATALILFNDIPGVDVHYLPVIRWDKEMIIAADSPTAPTPICVWSQITINLRVKTITATDTRKQGKGHEGLNTACEKVPLAQTYQLMKQAVELLHRQMPNSQKKAK
jgi:hypothetical protein